MSSNVARPVVRLEGSWVAYRAAVPSAVPRVDASGGVPDRRRWAAPALMTAAGIVVLAGSFMPWLRSGATRRSSFELFDVVDRLGFTPGGAFGWAVRLWPLVPLLVVCAVVAVWWERRLIAALLGSISGVYVAAVGFGVQLAPDAGLIGVEVGATVTAVGGVVLLLASAWAGWQAVGPAVRSSANSGVRSATSRAR